MFTLHGIDQQERPVLRVNLRRAQMVALFRKRPPTVIALEACGGSHYWAREFAALGCLASLIETCKLNGVNPQIYFTDLITRLVNDWPQNRIDEVMPWLWATQQTP